MGHLRKRIQEIVAWLRGGCYADSKCIEALKQGMQVILSFNLVRDIIQYVIVVQGKEEYVNLETNLSFLLQSIMSVGKGNCEGCVYCTYSCLLYIHTET